MRIFRDVQAMLTALCGLFLVLSLVVLIPGLEPYRHPALPILSVVFGSYFALKAAARAVQDRRLDVNILMVLAAAGAIVVGHVEDAAALLFLFSLSSTLEHMAMAKTQSAIESLIKLRPDTAIRVVDGGDEMVPTESLRVGDVVRVLPFQQIPADGTMLQAHASIDESAMTGESTAIEKQEGDRLMAGTQNLDSMLTMRVSAEVGESTLEKIVAIVQEAQENKASGERISQWFGQTYTIFVVACFLVSLGVRWMLGGSSAGFDWMGQALYPSLILLVALSPCAVVISTPASTLSALAYAARRGILVRGGEFIEIAGTIRVVALDKTGTLTEGKPKLVEVCIGHPVQEACLAAIARDSGHSCPECTAITCWHREDTPGAETREALRFAGGAEAFSTHPIAQAIVAAAKAEAIDIPEAESHRAVSGFGIEARIEGTDVKIGQLRFFDSEGELPSGFREHVDEMRTRGLTAVLMRYGNEWCALGLRDEPRPTAKAFVEDLHEAGVKRVAVLTGDNAATAQAVAQELGIDEVYAGILPDEKAELIQKWVSSKVPVAMVGDGVNDAPALASANLGVAMGGLGSDIALKAADVVLVQDRIERVPELMRLGQMANRIIRTNLFFASGVIVALTVSSLFFSLPLPVAVVGHEGSTVLVILNGLRLLRGPGIRSTGGSSFASPVTAST
ncbi:MAG TPA: cation-translocating P-type ATPase [Fimbriimonadaceae bacterium]|nr:cation-translocating P-type ATPase [Fimbriimonadaceae bacterium]HRJ96147.1 cation-translocating P-type ATPase [Fimbriimonadaceae bacterium]